LKEKEKGFTTHAEVTKAFNSGGHTDPGSGFPMDYFLSLVRKYQKEAAEETPSLWEGESKVDVPIILQDGKAFCPVTYLASKTGQEVAWDPETKRVTLTKK
jgi:hypothetical protein